MAGFTPAVEQALLNHFLTDPAYTPPTTMYLALSTTTPNRDGTNFTEPSSGGYARVSTTGADWSAATGTAPAVKTNTSTKSFPIATSDWSSGANMVYFGLFDSASVGNLLASGPLTTAKPVLNGDTASFASSALRIEIGVPGDTF